jgi:hypothetical protein
MHFELYVRFEALSDVKMWMEVFMTEDGGVITRKTTIYTILAQTS